MKEITITMIPSNPAYPTIVETTTDIKKAVYGVYHDVYDVKIMSDWYETYLGKLVVDAEKNVNVRLKFKQGTLSIMGDSGFVTVNGEKKAIPTSYSLPYQDTPYTVMLEKKFHRTIVKSISINPSNQAESVTPSFVFLEGEWRKEVVSTEKLPYTTRFKTDTTKTIGYREVETLGVEGVKTYYIEREYVYSEATGRTRNESWEITTQPKMEVVIVGQKDTLVRNENIVNSGELLALDNIIKGVVPDRELKKEDGSFYETFVYKTSGKTTFDLNAQYLNKDDSYIFSMDMRFPFGTDTSLMEIFFEPDVKRTVPKPIADGKWHRLELRYTQNANNFDRFVTFGWNVPSGISFDARRVKIEKETSNNILYGFPLPHKLKPEEAGQVKVAIGKGPTPW